MLIVGEREPRIAYYNNWIPVYTGMTENGVFRLLAKGSLLPVLKKDGLNGKLTGHPEIPAFFKDLNIPVVL